MKLQKYTVIVFLILVVRTQCGLIDNIYGRVKNTTNALKQDVRNVWSYSKSIVGIENDNPNVDNRTEEEKRGLIGGMAHTARGKVHSIRNYFWNTDELANDAGIFGNMFNRVKNHLSKIKGSILGDDLVNVQTIHPLSENAQRISDTLNKLFFRNGSRQVHGHAFQEAIENLRRKLHAIRSNMTVTTATPVHHGEGLIDIRIAAGNIQDTFNDNTVSINNDVYDKVDDSLSVIRDNTAKSYDDVKENIDIGVDKLRNNVDGAADQLTGLKDKLSDVTAKENQLLADSFKKINGQNVVASVENTVEDAKRLSY